MSTEKRIFIALILSFLVLLIYSKLVPTTQHVVNKEVTRDSAPLKDVLQPEGPLPQQAPDSFLTPELNKYNSLENNELDISGTHAVYTFSKTGGFLMRVFDKTHNAEIAIENIGLMDFWLEQPFEANVLENGVAFTFADSSGPKVKKVFRVVAPYQLELTVMVSNGPVGALKDASFYLGSGYNITAGSLDIKNNSNPIDKRYYEIAFSSDELVSRRPASKIRNSVAFDEKLGWAGIRDRYYCSLVRPELDITSLSAANYDGTILLRIKIPSRHLNGPIDSFSDKFRIYVGPQEEAFLKTFEGGAEKIINFGVFNKISKAMLFLLNGIHKGTKNWGLSIILFTIFIYLLLFPLSSKSMFSMKKVQAVQPKVEELRNRLKDDPKKMNIELMELYRREKVNPLGGCFPMLLQIPVFFSLYQVLMRFISLKGAPFLWIKDLSAPDRLFVFSRKVPILGNEFNILPLLMGGVMFLQQKFSSPTALGSSSTADQQKMMSFMMPILFCFLFYKLPSGLVLYWFTNSLLMFAFQWRISKIKL